MYLDTCVCVCTGNVHVDLAMLLFPSCESLFSDLRKVDEFPELYMVTPLPVGTLVFIG